MKEMLIVVMIFLGILIFRAMKEALNKTKNQNFLEQIILKKFFDFTKENNEKMDINYDAEIIKILELDERKVFKLIGKMIKNEDYTGYYKKRYQEYGLKDYLNKIIDNLEELKCFKNIIKDENSNIEKAIKNDEYRNYKFKYHVDKWIINTNADFYIILATFNKENNSYFVFGMSNY